jgi:hypothetical protein
MNVLRPPPSLCAFDASHPSSADVGNVPERGGAFSEEETRSVLPLRVVAVVAGSGESLCVLDVAGFRNSPSNVRRVCGTLSQKSTTGWMFVFVDRPVI